MTRYLGIDPGLSGALAIVETINGLPTLVDAIDMPATGTGSATGTVGMRLLSRQSSSLRPYGHKR